MTRKELHFILNAFVIALVVLAVMHTVKPYLDPKVAEIAVLERQFVVMDADRVVDKLQSLSGKPTMLVVYASWCGYCRQMLPDIIALMRVGALDDFNSVFLSRDWEPKKLAAYLIHSEYERLVTPYLLAPKNDDALKLALARTGSQYSGGIPYVGYFDASGGLLGEFHGVAGKEELLASTRRIAAQLR